MARFEMELGSDGKGVMAVDGKDVPGVLSVGVEMDWQQSDMPQVEIRVLASDGTTLTFGDADVRIDVQPVTQSVSEDIACACEGRCALDTEDVPTGLCKLRREIPKEIRHLVGIPEEATHTFEGGGSA